MATRKELQVTSFDHDELKASLIDYLKSTQEFGDFDYEGSSINTLVDLLVRNAHYDAYMANFLASESFLDSAQIRASVVSHASKLSYVPRSRTCARLMCDITVTPPSTDNIPNNIVMETGTVFLVSDGNATYSFTSHEPYTLSLSGSEYVVSDVELYQGQRIRNQFVHTRNEMNEIPNPDLDTSTLQVDVASASDLNERVSYRKAESITELDSSQRLFFIGESTNGLPTIEFGRDILGVEPADESVVYVSGINVESDHANGASSLIPASTIGGYSNIQVSVTKKAVGGSERENIEDIRFLAPKAYQAQGRALTDTDYIPIIKAQYPFIRSVITWGGEDNNPPQYGKVFMSFISEEGSFLTNSVKESIVSFLKDYNVGSITPEIVDPVGYGLNLSVRFSYDNRQTNKTFNQLSNDIQSLVNQFNEQRVNEFGKFYNNSFLVGQIMDMRGVVSVDVSPTVYREIDVLRFSSPIYDIDFGNAIKSGSVWMEDFKVDANGINHRMYDEEGDLVVVFERDGATITQTVGEVDYDSGEINFVVDMIQDQNTVQVMAEPVAENFYIDQNRYIFIDDVTIGMLDTRG